MYIALLPMDGVRGRSEDASPAVMDDAAAIGSRVRRGHIPVRFELSSLDLTSVGPPEPTYVLVRRTATFLHYIPDLIDSFAKHVADGSRDVWLECSVLGPLQWQYPVGVLFDCQAGSSGDRAGILPYRLVVHFSGFPAQCVMRPVTSSLGKCPGEFHFIHSLKQAFFMQCGTTNPVMDLSSAELHALWRSCVEDVANEESIVQPALATRSSRRLPGVSDATNVQYQPLRNGPSPPHSSTSSTTLTSRHCRSSSLSMALCYPAIRPSRDFAGTYPILTTLSTSAAAGFLITVIHSTLVLAFAMGSFSGRRT
ncbi:hypothetical protein PBRA_001559 [Plasmodiophora brassicae]|uniref:Uncharacterized protein n=1 Tax=Plasmodiophora brassicae TaxID=37360 RepID=A0A0G4IYU8_PLABS|nr:hypothetical protein PBRA_001559 [Plasmodiophora brassicae]